MSVYGKRPFTLDAQLVCGNENEYAYRDIFTEIDGCGYMGQEKTMLNFFKKAFFVLSRCKIRNDIFLIIQPTSHLNSLYSAWIVFQDFKKIGEILKCKRY